MPKLQVVIRWTDPHKEWSLGYAAYTLSHGNEPKRCHALLKWRAPIENPRVINLALVKPQTLSVAARSEHHTRSAPRWYIIYRLSDYQTLPIQLEHAGPQVFRACISKRLWRLRLLYGAAVQPSCAAHSLLRRVPTNTPDQISCANQLLVAAMGSLIVSAH